MKILNLTPDSFWPESRVAPDDFASNPDEVLARLEGADIVDLGAVSTRPGAPDVAPEEEWARLKPALTALKAKFLAVATSRVEGLSINESGTMPSTDAQRTVPLPQISIDTYREQTVRRAYELIGPFIVNDVRAGDDPQMLRTVAELHLPYVAVHHRGDARTMDSLCDYGPGGVVDAVMRFFEDFAKEAARLGIEQWILDPGFGFAKTDSQNMELLRAIPQFKRFGRPILVGIADKRFTRGRSAELEAEAERLGADIIRRH